MRPDMQSRSAWPSQSLPAALVVVLAFACGSRTTAQVDPYELAVVEAAAQPFIEQPAWVFEDLRSIDPEVLRLVEVPDGAGGTRLAEVVALSTLTSYVVPYEHAQPLDRFVLDSSGFYRSNLWTTVAGDAAAYYLRRGLPLGDEETVSRAMLQSLGMRAGPPYRVLTILVEPRFVARPSLSPAITESIAPWWNGRRYQYTPSPGAPDAAFHGFAPTVIRNGAWQRPFTSFAGPRAFPAWLAAWTAASSDLAGDRRFPFTGLGWTWNWSEEPALRGFAISEFLVSGGAEFWFVGLRTPREVLVAAAADRGDLDFDGIVGGIDLAILLGEWGMIDPPIGDLDHDGIVGPSDLLILLAAWGPLAS